MDPEDQDRLRRAIALAPRGRHRVEPNPYVGCVLARDGRIVGEGWHAFYGGPHAEIAALQAAGDAARGATAYVSLEPCSRRGKTGPCVDALAEAGIARVVYAATDPSEDGAGKRKLEALGVEVAGPVLEEAGDALLGPFRWARAASRPWVALKWAITLDGRIAEGPGRGGVISGAKSRAYAHVLRAHSDAVAVGLGTVLADDPRLTVRDAASDRPAPLRVVIDSRLRTPPGARLFEEVERAPLLFVVADPDPDRRQEVEARGATILAAPGPDGRVDLAQALRGLRARGVHRLVVEGGARIHGALLGAGLADQVTAFVAPRILGNAEAPGAVAAAGFPGLDRCPRLSDVTWRRLGDDLMVEGALRAFSERHPAP